MTFWANILSGINLRTFVDCLDQSIYALFQWMACGIIFQKKIGSMGCQWSCHDSCEGHLHVGHGVLTIWLIDH